MAQTIWQPQPGPQTQVLQAETDEILSGGARGGGKTLGGILWLMKGDWAQPKDSSIYQTALNYPRYRGLVLRREAQDLRDWVDQAWEIFKETGAQVSGQPRCFVWKTGAKIYTDHLNDEQAYNKYRGWSLHRILIEELTEIPLLKWYLRILGSLRSKKDGDQAIIKPQLLSTTNPDGVGHQWVKQRFIMVYGKNGIIAPRTPMRDPVSGLTRIFIPSTLDDNKFLGQEYESKLLAQRADSEATFLAWRYGRWDVFEGAFFSECRFDGPMPGEPKEPEEANHSFEMGAPELSHWWPRAIGVDWGYEHEAAAYWGCHNQIDKRLYVYREFITRHLGSRQLGQEIARRSIDDLAGLPDHHIPLFLSHDAFSKEDATRTRAELFVEGIRDVLGPNSAYIADFTDAERKMKPEDALESMEHRYTALAEGNCITVHRARQDRAAMAAYVRDLLHWRKPEKREPDIEYARKLLTEPDGYVLYERYLDKFRNVKEPNLPKVKIERSCRRLRECMTSLVYDPDNTEVPQKLDSTGGSPGDDPYDGFCHLVIGFRTFENRKPRNVFVGERLDWLRSRHGVDVDPGVFHQVLHKAHEDYTKGEGSMEPVTLDRLM